MEKTFRVKNPVLDKSGECLDAEVPDIVAEPPDLEGEIDTPVNDDNDGPVSEPSVAENEDPNEEDRRGKEPDFVAEGSRDSEPDQLRQSLKQSRRMDRLPELSFEKKEETVKEMESRWKKARVNVSELLHDAFLAKASRSKRKAMAWTEWS